MRTKLALFLVAIISLLLAACVPDRIVWSPDGNHALLLAGDGLYVIAPDGTPGPLLLERASRAAWLPDGKRILLVHTVVFNAWDQIVKADLAHTLAPGTAATVKTALVNNRNDKDAAQKALGNLDPDQLKLALLFLRDTDKSIAQEIGENISFLNDTSYEPPVVQLADIAPDNLKLGPILLYGKADRVVEIRLSPNGLLAAVTVAPTDNKLGDPQLFVVSTGGKKEDDALSLGSSSTFPDFSPDSKSLVFVRPLSLGMGDSAKPATLSRQTIVDAAGALLPAKDLPAREELSGFIFDGHARVRCAPDGRIFFSAAPISLPAAPNDLDTAPSIFFVHPGKQATVSRAIPRSAEATVGNNPQYFELSPDAAHLSIPFDDGRLAILDIAAGTATLVQPTPFTSDPKLASIPTWRNNTQLTFVRPAENAQGLREAVLYDLTPGKSATPLSTTWSDAMKNGWLSNTNNNEKKPDALP